MKSHKGKTGKAKFDAGKAIADKIIELLEKGVSPWHCPWSFAGGRRGIQMSALDFIGTVAFFASVVILFWLYLFATPDQYSAECEYQRQMERSE